MSVTRLVRGAAAKDVGLPQTAGGPQVAGGDFIPDAGAAGLKPSTLGESYLGKVIAYVPGEIIAVYVTVLGVLVPRTDRSKWGAFIGTLVLLWASVLLNNAVARRKTSRAAGQQVAATKPGWPKQLLVALVSSVAFATYAFALPTSPLGSESTRVATLIAISLALLLPQVGTLLNIDPDSEE